MLKTLQVKYKSTWKNHIKNLLLLTTTRRIEQPAIHSIFCYLDDELHSQLTLFLVSKTIIFNKQMMIVKLKIGKRL